jgi:hypothetical protein
MSCLHPSMKWRLAHHFFNRVQSHIEQYYTFSEVCSVSQYSEICSDRLLKNFGNLFLKQL